jgi:hypothetical protein
VRHVKGEGCVNAQTKCRLFFKFPWEINILKKLLPLTILQGLFHLFSYLKKVNFDFFWVFFTSFIYKLM